MKLGVISDVHSNIHALRAAHAKLQELMCTEVVCLGDLVGYGASPVEVIEYVRDNGIPTTLGASESRMIYHFGHQLEPRTGITAGVDPLGRVLEHLPQNVQGALLTRYAPLETITPYVRLGVGGGAGAVRGRCCVRTLEARALVSGSRQCTGLRWLARGVRNRSFLHSLYGVST